MHVQGCGYRRHLLRDTFVGTPLILKARGYSWNPCLPSGASTKGSRLHSLLFAGIPWGSRPCKIAFYRAAGKGFGVRFLRRLGLNSELSWAHLLHLMAPLDSSLSSASDFLSLFGTNLVRTGKLKLAFGHLLFKHQRTTP